MFCTAVAVVKKIVNSCHSTECNLNNFDISVDWNNTDEYIILFAGGSNVEWSKTGSNQKIKNVANSSETHEQVSCSLVLQQLNIHLVSVAI